MVCERGGSVRSGSNKFNSRTTGHVYYVSEILGKNTYSLEAVLGHRHPLLHQAPPFPLGCAPQGGRAQGPWIRRGRRWNCVGSIGRVVSVCPALPFLLHH